MNWNSDAIRIGEKAFGAGSGGGAVTNRSNSEYEKIEKQVNDARNLFIKSLSYHNPLEKADSSVFMKNAAALMEMEQIANTQKYLYSLSESFEGIQLSATLPGKKIFVPTDAIMIDKEGKATLEYILPPNLAKNASLVLEVFDKDGNVIYTQDIRSDSSKIVWNVATAGISSDTPMKFRVVEKYDKKRNDITKAKGVFDVVEYVYSEIGPDGNRVNLVKTKNHPPMVLQKNANWAVGAGVDENIPRTIQESHVMTKQIAKLEQDIIENSRKLSEVAGFV